MNEIQIIMGLRANHKRLKIQYDKLKRKAIELDDALRDYGRHGQECYFDQGDMCICGWSEIRQKFFGD